MSQSRHSSATIKYIPMKLKNHEHVHLDCFFCILTFDFLHQMCNICTFVLESEDQSRVNSSLIHKTQISNYIYQQYYF